MENTVENALGILNKWCDITDADLGSSVLKAMVEFASRVKHSDDTIYNSRMNIKVGNPESQLYS